ncbi:MAG: M28 family peptidase [Microscillaceae bacterium]|jgi:Zn-dependent M28 family amino/carboxypeptidase|nr:M28 family peptidase [Microscillaceae bacterium]
MALQTNHIPVQTDRLYQSVSKLTLVEPARNFQNVQSLNEIAEYIQTEFKKWDCRVHIQKFWAEDQMYQNIIASFGNPEAPRIVLGAHYDVDGDQPGADDNASAVAGLLEVGYLLHELKPDLKYRVDLVAFCLEEAPFFDTEWMGSTVYAQSLLREDARVKAMICLEMIGYYTDEPNSQKFPAPEFAEIYPNQGNFVVVVGKLGQEALVKNVQEAMQTVAQIDVQSICAPQNLQIINLSDHYSFWKAGYEAVMITDTSFLRNPNYHLTSDTIDTLDFNRMAEVVKGVYWAIINL